MPPQEIGPALDTLMAADENTLFEQLGLRTRAVPMQEAEIVEFDPSLTHDTDIMGPLDDLRDLGRRILRRWSRELHSIACGSTDEDSTDRESIVSALGIGDVALGGALASVLMGSFGVAPAVATVVGALIVKRLGGPAADELCEFWAESLEED